MIQNCIVKLFFYVTSTLKLTATCTDCTPLVCKPKNKFYIIKNAWSKNGEIADLLLCRLLFSNINNYKCGWKRILVGYIFMLK